MPNSVNRAARIVDCIERCHQRELLEEIEHGRGRAGRRRLELAVAGILLLAAAVMGWVAVR